MAASGSGIGQMASGSGIGQMASGAFKSLVGVGQLIAGGVQKKQAKKLEPQETDPNLVSMLDTFRTLRRAYSTGSEASSYRNIINRNMASGTNAVTALSGGNTGGTLAALVSTQSRADDAASQLAAQLEKNRLGVLQMEDQQNDEIAQRKLDVRMMKYLQKMGQATSNIKGGTANWAAGIEEFGGGLESAYTGGISGGASGGSPIQ